MSYTGLQFFFLFLQTICLGFQFRSKSFEASTFWFGCVTLLTVAVLAAGMFASAEATNAITQGAS